jgi:acetylxylan esterase
VTTRRIRIVGSLAITLGLIAAAPAQAASLQAVTTSLWSKGDVPTYISMYIYVPNTVATNPPILVVSHYCGGSASGVFGQAQSGGIVSASDTYGFIMIYPQTTNPASSSNCWEVASTKSLTHNGGGDTQAVAEMVSYTITKYSANANRVYATGTSSGAMMTEALLAVYPDVFKAGAEFSGVPAGCWSDGWSAASNWGGNCASGKTTFTAQQWGDKVRAMYPGYSGYRPRIQLWHGASDTTISPNNQTEAIKEWTNVLGLTTSPTTTTTVSFKSHSWTRQSWQDSCGYTVLDAWLEASGPHGTDANLDSTYVIPFLALDKSGATDPQICSSAGGSSGTGGAPGVGGTSAAGGAKTGGASSIGGSTHVTAGGSGAVGGSKATGGSQSAGGNVPTGGMLGAGGSAPTGGRSSVASGGNSPATGGRLATGGSVGTGTATGGSVVVSTGGNSSVAPPATGGMVTQVGGANSTGGNSAAVGGETEVTNTGAPGPSNSGGCSCAVANRPSPAGLFGLALGAVVALQRRRRLTRTTRRGPN